MWLRQVLQYLNRRGRLRSHLRLLLFDIDGTLLLTGGASVRAMARALVDACAVEDPLRGVRLGGGVDPALVRRALRDNAPGRFAPGPAEDEAIRAACELYLEHLEGEIARSDTFRVLPGVPELLATLAEPVARGEAVLALGTGNLERGARIKLARAGLNDHFPFGGFADDAEERGDVLRAAVARAEAHAGARIEPECITVIGDTPADVAAARAIGARAVAVATGFVEIEALRAVGPDVALADLAGPGVLEALGL